MNQMSPFDITKTITEKKSYLEDLSTYNTHFINKILAQHPDTVLYANEMNMNYAIPVKWQYDYYYHGIRSKKRYATWFGKMAFDDVKEVMKYFGMNERKAKEAITILSQEQLSKIRQKCGVGLERCHRY